MFFFVLTNDKIDKTRLAKRQTKIKKRERRQNKKQKEHAARSGTRTRDLSHFGFVGDRITRGRSIQPRHLKCRSCSVCLYKAHSERGRSTSLAKSKRDSEQPDDLSAGGPPIFDLHFSKKKDRGSACPSWRARPLLLLFL